VTLVASAALGITAAGLVAAAATLVATRRPWLAVQVLLDFLLAAGLLGLTGSPGWPALAAAAAVVALRAGLAGVLRRSAGTSLVPGQGRP